MNHLILEKYSEVISVLERFFKLNYNRNSIPKFFPNEDKEVFSLACRIYKRGFINSVMSTESTPSLKTTNYIFQNADPFTNISLQKYNTNTFFLVDKNFYAHHPITKPCYSFQPSESSKSLISVRDILISIPENTESIFVIGGGITLDIGGFVAGLLNLPVHYLPTTLLSAVDASIGGKTGVNFSPHGKNQIGLFYESNSLYFVPEYLSTLSHEEKLCGVVEAAKHSYLFGEFEADAPFLEKIISKSILKDELIYIVHKNFQYKLNVVQLDPHEKNGIRAYLNFGHTLAHILETLAEEQFIETIPHGFAVGHGIKFLFDFHFIPPKNNFIEFINKIIANHRISLKKDIPVDVIIQILLHDKKNNSQDKCTLSLTEYGLFKGDINENRIRQEFSIFDISQKIKSYLEIKHNFQVVER